MGKTGEAGGAVSYSFIVNRAVRRVCQNLCQGKSGADGEKGRPGSPGEQGLTGVPGSQGPKGAQGKSVRMHVRIITLAIIHAPRVYV